MNPLGWLVVVAIAGCSENFGTTPVDTRQRIEVAAEEAVGPLPASVAALTLAGTSARLSLGLEQGLYHASPASGEWLPGHPGFSPTDTPTTPRSIVLVDVDRSGRVALHVSRSVGPDRLFASVDGGTTFRELDVPNIIAGVVDAVAALPASSLHPDGAFLVAQGAGVYVRDLSGDWLRATLPATPQRVRAAAGGVRGEVALGVADADGAPLVWWSADGGATFVEAELGDELDTQVLDIAVSDRGAVAVATPTRLVGPLGAVQPPAGIFSLADVDFDAERARYAGLTTESTLLIGDLEPTAAPQRVDAPAGVVDVLVTAQAVFAVSNPSARLWQLEGNQWRDRPFEGRSLSWTALASDPRQRGSIYLGHLRGKVFFGDPAAMMQDLSCPLIVSAISALLPDTGSSAGAFIGDFGVQLIETNTPGAPWLERSTGQFSLIPDVFGGPVTVQTLRADPDDGQHLWLGSQLGDGPYESFNGGLLWTRVEGGLGEQKPFIGFPAVTQVRAFAFVAGETWMATFRGGVWKLDESTRIWGQSNRGLPDISGALVDTCCFDPPDPDDIFAPPPTEVDVRDLVALEGGGLLAATGYGVFFDARRDGGWEDYSNGLTNRDVFTLALHEDRPQWVLAGARGTADNPDWLFLSRDGGHSWNPIDSRLRARVAEDVVWSDPSTLEITAILNGSGAWRMEIAP